MVSIHDKIKNTVAVKDVNEKMVKSKNVQTGDFTIHAESHLAKENRKFCRDIKKNKIKSEATEVKLISTKKCGDD